MEDNIRINRLVIIGNGFDLAHGLKTSYKDFIRWYLDDFFNKLINNDCEFSDILLDIKGDPIKRMIFKTPEMEMMNISVKEMYEKALIDPLDFLNQLEEKITVEKSYFLDRILKNIETKGWTDIESDYYALLKENANNIEDCKSLNNQMDFLRDKLAEYLKTQKADTHNVKNLIDICKDIENEDDIAESAIKKIKNTNLGYFNNPGSYLKIENIMLLDFNYTSTTEMYIDPKFINHIHGSLENRKQMIFGYGDEMDKDFQELEDKNENELLKNSKSVKYLEADNYRKLLKFIEGGMFQVYIMGHSCGNSDRTLLNTIFEHENCVSIKPFYYKWGEKEGEDTYSDITRNIYRNFKNKVLYRDRVVNKTQCKPMPQLEK